MRTTLFCKNPYAFGILKPIHDELISRAMPVLWFIPKDIDHLFPFKEIINKTSSIQDVASFNNDIIIVPGNEVPHYLKGLKVQIFHGLAGEKKGHFRIRHYFDLYLTQGPYFTEQFEKLARKYKNFDVIETGWPKLDSLFTQQNAFNDDKQILLNEHNAKKIILYAPTFSPSLTSAISLKDEIQQVASIDRLLLIKFHDLMNKEIVEEYKEIEKRNKNIRIIYDNNITKYLILADMLISDTSSVVYEFLLLNKPAITFKSSSKHIRWMNISSPDQLLPAINGTLTFDAFAENRKWIIDNYHPYTDGLSSKRMIDALLSYLETNPVPARRKINWFRRQKMIKMFGKLK